MFNCFSRSLKTSAVAILGSLLIGAYAQDGYHVSEGYQPDAATADNGPVRLARFSFVGNGVSWRPGSGADWSPAAVNTPIRQGSEVWVASGGRAELQFDDGSIAQLGSAVSGDGGVFALKTLYSDAKGEFTEIAVNSGLIGLYLTNNHSLYQVDTTAISAKAYGPAKFRVGAGQGVEVVCRSGEVAVQNNATLSLLLEPRDSVYGGDTNTALEATVAPQEDAFDQFIDMRNSAMVGHAGYVPANIAVCAGDLGSAGGWRVSGSYGQVWYPRVAAGWAPYHYGHWVFVRPFGWTWCSEETWGWAPYHYGTWVNTNYGWGWVPGPAQQCWSPAVVHFTSFNGQVAWCPLAPAEVHYSVGIGINLGGGFSLGFSIGSVGCYYPTNNGYCQPQVFNNVQVNRITTITNVTNVTTINNYYTNTTSTNVHFVPQNSKLGAGSTVPTGNFGRTGGAPQFLPKGQHEVFEKGQSFSGQGGRVMSGPPGVQVTPQSFTPFHTFKNSAPPATVLNRPLLRSSLPPTIEKESAPTRTQFVAPRPNGTNPGRPTNPVRTGGPIRPANPPAFGGHSGSPLNGGSGRVNMPKPPINQNRPAGPKNPAAHAPTTPPAGTGQPPRNFNPHPGGTGNRPAGPPAGPKAPANPGANTHRSNPAHRNSPPKKPSTNKPPTKDNKKDNGGH